MKRTLTLLLFCSCFGTFHGSVRDSLLTVWYNTENSDSLRMKSLQDLSWNELLFTNPDSSFIISKMHYQFAHEIKNQNQMALAMNTMASAKYVLGDFEKAIHYYLRSIKIKMDNHNKTGVAYGINNLAVVYRYKGDYFKAVELHSISLKLQEELRDYKGVGTCLNNIGNIYYELDEYDKALEYYERSLEYKQMENDKKGIATAYNNLGGVFLLTNSDGSAIEHFNKSLEIEKELGDVQGQAISQFNIGVANINQQKYDWAEDALIKSIELYERIGDSLGISACYNGLAVVELNRKNYDKTLNHSTNALNIAGRIGGLSEMKNAKEHIYESLRGMKEYQKCFIAYQSYVLLKDSLDNLNIQSEMIKQETKHEFYRENMFSNHLKSKSIKELKERIRNRDVLQYWIIALCLVTLFAVMFFFGKFRVPLKFSEGMVFFAFLILFEFLIVMFDPIIDNYTGGAPVIKLVINSLLALSIFPLHGMSERVFKKRLLSGNRKV